MKYSEFLQIVIDRLRCYPSDEFYICNLLRYNTRLREHPKHCKTLKASIDRKLDQLGKKYNFHTSTLLHLEAEYSLDLRQSRIKWLEGLAKYHASRGN